MDRLRSACLAILATLAITAVVLSGCGSDGDDKPPAPSKPATTPRASGDRAATTTTTPAPRAKQSPAKPKSQPKAAAIEKVLAKKNAKRKLLPPTIKRLISQIRREGIPKSKQRAELYARLPAKYRVRVLKHFAPIILKAFGFKGAKVQVLPGGQTVRVTLPKSQACKAHPDEAARIRRSLRQAISPKRPLPYPRTVAVTVAGSGQPIATYLARSCKRISLPTGGKGRIVLSESGSRGSTRTKPFSINTKRWTIEYASRGDFFQIWVFKGKEAQSNIITLTRPGSGKKAFSGPGKFKLNIGALNDWSVRVREGG